MAGTGDYYCIGLDRNLVEPPPRLFRSTTVLTRAITSTASRQAKYLLEKGCDPNAVVSDRRLRPLMVACFVVDKKKRMAILRCLMKHGADPTLGDVYGRNSMMYACALGLRDETELMVKDCDYDLNATDMYGDTPLHMCAKAGSTQVLAVLLGEMLKHRMDISLQNHSFLSPLSLAILNGNHECARILHQVGACPRFSKSKLHSVVWVVRNNRNKISSAGLKAIHDSKKVGKVFGVAKPDFLGSACSSSGEEEGVAATSWKGWEDVWPEADRDTICDIPESASEILKFPELLPVCK